MNAGEKVGVGGVLAAAGDDHFLVALDGVCLLRRNERGADVGEIGAQRLGAQHRVAIADGAGQRDRTVEPFPECVDNGERRQCAGMTARAGRHRNQAVSPLLDSLSRESVRDDVVQHHTAIGMGGQIDVLAGTQRGDDDRCLPLGRGLNVMLQPVVRLVHDVIHSKRCRRGVRMITVPFGQFFRDAVQPLVQQ